ncbi:uncharacterized protein [Aegilops tauschii subsp. strangulata]|uniref:uncharacterized protein n=1 Tax=Aegilops tauschii subsp. strangulata TaxID=200361 RepID=UPI003CC846B0
MAGQCGESSRRRKKGERPWPMAKRTPEKVGHELEIVKIKSGVIQPLVEELEKEEEKKKGIEEKKKKIEEWRRKDMIMMAPVTQCWCKKEPVVTASVTEQSPTR